METISKSSIYDVALKMLLDYSAGKVNNACYETA